MSKALKKKFKKELFTKFAKAINEYELLKPNDKVAVCISGGKDSMLLAKLFQELKNHNKFKFELVFLAMNPGYNDENFELIVKNANKLGIPLTIFESDIFENVGQIVDEIFSDYIRREGNVEPLAANAASTQLLQNKITKPA